MDDIVKDTWADIPPVVSHYEVCVRKGVSLMNALALALAAHKWPQAHPSEIHLEPYDSGDSELYLKIRWSHKIITHIEGNQ